MLSIGAYILSLFMQIRVHRSEKAGGAQKTTSEDGMLVERFVAITAPRSEGAGVWSFNVRALALRATGALLAIAALLATGGVSSALAKSITIVPEADSFLNQASPGVNIGSYSLLVVRSYHSGFNIRTILRFNISGIPSGSTINSVSFKLFPTSYPAVNRMYDLFYSSNDTWSETGVTWNNQPNLDAKEDSISTGSTPSTTLYYTWGAAGPNPNTEGLTSRTRLKFQGNKELTLIVKDDNEDSDTDNITYFSSREGIEPPELIVNYTPPAVCTGPSIALTGFDPVLTGGPNPPQAGAPETWEIHYQITAGCEALSYVKTQGGIGGNLVIDNIDTNNVGSATAKEQPGAGGNNVITWIIHSGLAANTSANLTATVTTGINPAGGQLFTSCGIYPLTGQWSSSAVVAPDAPIAPGSIVTSGYTDNLVVDIPCP